MFILSFIYNIKIIDEYKFHCAELDPLNCAYYSNRAATYMMLYNFINALDDSRRSVELDPSFSKVRLLINTYVLSIL